MLSGCGGSRAKRRKSGGSAACSLTGNTNSESGIACWNVRPARKSTSFPASVACFVPASTPANSVTRKQLSSSTPTGVVLASG